MSAIDPIRVSPQSAQENESLRALDSYLAPWRITRVGQGDDFGRDGFVQVVETGRDGSLAVSPLTFGLQAKSTAEPVAAIDIDTRHLGMWSAPTASPLVVALWTKSADTLRFRTARDIVRELDQTRPTWRSQGTTSIAFGPTSAFTTAEEAREAIARAIRDELDVSGGVHQIHLARRRIVLTTCFWGTVSTSQTITATGDEGPFKDVQVTFGEGWQTGDLDSYEVNAARVLISSLLLYEEVWVPMQVAGLAVVLFGEAAAIDLLERRRLCPYGFDDIIGFVAWDGSRRGSVASLRLVSDGGLRDRFSVVLKSLDAAVVRKLFPFVHRVNLPGPLIADQTARDLQKPHTRRLLGLPQEAMADEATMDATLANRLVTINVARAAAAILRADTIQYEGGLSRLASEKDYEFYGLDRNFSSAVAFDKALRSLGVPDVGQLLGHLDLSTLVQLANSRAAQDFRDWFWSTIAQGLAEGNDLAGDFLEKLLALARVAPSAVRLPVELKRRFLDSLGADYLVGRLPRTAFATTSKDGDAILARQRISSQARRFNQLTKMGSLPQPYAPCVCGSSRKFRFCCGRRM